MNELKQLESLGLVLPSPAYIFGAILFGIIGWVAFRRGRKSSVSVLTWTGVALMLYPYGVSEAWMLWLIGIALSALVYAKWD
jgi:ABC-type Fe3+-siderophore transport system permease subunit